MIAPPAPEPLDLTRLLGRDVAPVGGQERVILLACIGKDLLVCRARF